jgi:hypothetical protein
MHSESQELSLALSKQHKTVDVSCLKMKMGKSPVSDTLCFLLFSILEDGQSIGIQWFWVL